MMSYLDTNKLNQLYIRRRPGHYFNNTFQNVFKGQRNKKQKLSLCKRIMYDNNLNDLST